MEREYDSKQSEPVSEEQEEIKLEEPHFTHGTLPKKGFLENLAKKAEEIRRHGIELGKIAAKEAEELGEKIDEAVDEGWDTAKKFSQRSTVSKNDIIDLIERLAKLKEQGIITEKEFNSKKKDLLAKI